MVYQKTALRCECSCFRDGFFWKVRVAHCM